MVSDNDNDITLNNEPKIQYGNLVYPVKSLALSAPRNLNKKRKKP